MVRKEDIIERLVVLAGIAAKNFWKNRRKFSIKFEGRIFDIDQDKALLITVAICQPIRELGWSFVGLFPRELISIVEDGFKNKETIPSDVSTQIN